jgi:hypothetical protein
MSASLSVPNLDAREPTPTPNYNYGHATQQPPPSHLQQQQQQQHNFMMYGGHGQSVPQHPTPPTPPTMELGHTHSHHYPHHGQCGLSQYHSKSVPSVAAAVGAGGPNTMGGGSGDPYASHNSLNHDLMMPSSRPHSRNHSHHCLQQGCDYPA